MYAAGIPGPLSIEHRDAGSRARAGRLRLAHGEVRTPAFVPLATKGAVKTLESRDWVAGRNLLLRKGKKEFALLRVARR